MDIMVADVPAKFGMLLSRSWSAKLKGTMQMDFSYATIPIFGVQIKLYRENRLKYMINIKESPKNHPIYVVDIEMGLSIFYNSEFTDPKDHLVMINQKGDNKEMNEDPEISIDKKEQWFTMHFYGACSKEGTRIGIIVSTPYHIE